METDETVRSAGGCNDDIAVRVAADAPIERTDRLAIQPVFDVCDLHTQVFEYAK